MPEQHITHAFHPGQELPPYQVVAYNYATAAENRIHSDEIAAQYGFKGGLVPGVGVYAYMTGPVARLLGRAWLERGSMQGRFLKPVYDSEQVTVRGVVTTPAPLTISLDLFNSRDVLCATGEAKMPDELPPVDLADFPFMSAPARAARLVPRVAALPAGFVMGTVERELRLAEIETGFLQDMRDPLPLYRGPAACLHPAFLPAEGNEMFMANIDLGPWVHTDTFSRHYGLARDGETIRLRGRVAASFVKGGHDFVTLDLVMTGAADRLIAHMRHTAIIHLREDEP
ncbi:MAG: hypothetical protein ACKV2V_28130 [Blastocatellia bacterium]